EIAVVFCCAYIAIEKQLMFTVTSRINNFGNNDFCIMGILMKSKIKVLFFYLISCSLNLLKIVFLTLQNEIDETMKILIIEDEKELSKSIVEYLSGENYLCETAWTFQDAMSKIQSYEYDCIVLDIT